MKDIFKKLFRKNRTSELSDFCEVTNINRKEYFFNPQIETKILETFKGSIIEQKRTTRLESGRLIQTTKYGFLIKEIPWEESEVGKKDTPDPAEYTKPFQSDSPIVYVIKREKTEEGKRALAKILREECGQYDIILFF